MMQVITCKTQNLVSRSAIFTVKGVQISVGADLARLAATRCAALWSRPTGENAGLS